LWSRLYSIRERTLSRLFIRNLEATIATHNPVSPRADSVVGGNARKLEDLWSEHNAVGKRESGYGPVYAEILGDLPRVENVLELGVLGGGSHRAWAELWPEAAVYGLDIDPDTVINDGAITTYVADQLRVEDLVAVAEKMPSSFELVVDDGWHQPEAGLNSLMVFLPKLSPGGYYVVEDIDWLRYRRVWSRALMVLSRQYQVTVRVLDTPGSRIAVGGPYALVVLRAGHRI
jgi:hypothetical protein